MKYLFFVVCYPYYVRFGVFSGQHIFHQFRQQTILLCQHFQQTFFFGLLWRQTIYLNFFLGPPVNTKVR